MTSNRRTPISAIVGLLFTFALLQVTAHAVTKDKSALYAKYPQLVSPDTDPCVRGLNKMLIDSRTGTSQEVMLMSSMRGLNDLGSIHACTNGTVGDMLGDTGVFSALKLNFTHIPVALISGLCLPAECTQQNLTDFSNSAADKVNDLLIKVQEKTGIVDFDKGYGLVKPYTRLTVTMTQSYNAAEEWQESVRWGFIAALIFCGFVFVTFCMVPNFFLLCKHFKRNQTLEDSEFDWTKQSEAERESAAQQKAHCSERQEMRASSLLKSNQAHEFNAQLTMTAPGKLENGLRGTDAYRTLTAPGKLDNGLKGTDVYLKAASTSQVSQYDRQQLAASLYESRVTYKHQPHPQDSSSGSPKLAPSVQSNSLTTKILSFSIVRAWKSLSCTKCKEWDDEELDVIEGFKFFSFFLGQLCLTAQFLMCTQTINPWMIQRFFQELIFSIVVSSNIVMEAFTALSAFLGAYKLFQLYEAQGHLKVTDVLKFWARKYLRLAPMYYLIFFAGWGIFPNLGAGPIWYDAHTMYDECNDYWWAQLLMIGNIYPYFQAPNYGCFFWGWTITTDLQLALVAPLFVLAYCWREWIGHTLVFITVTVTSLGIAHCCLKYGLRAGPFAEENWYLFAYMFQKPFFKVHNYALGITAAFIYMNILSFRRIPDEEVRKQKHPVINYIHHSTLCHSIMFLLGFGLVLMNLLISHGAIAAPYSWTMTQNCIYFVAFRPIYVFGIFLILFTFFTGGFTFGKAFLSRSIFRVMGKLSFESALITPLMVQLIYSQLPNGLFVQFNKVLELGLGNVVCVMAASIVLYLLFEYPFKRLIELTLLPYCSNDEELQLQHVRRKVNAPMNHNVDKIRSEYDAAKTNIVRGRTESYPFSILTEEQTEKKAIQVENVDAVSSQTIDKKMRDSFD